MAVGGALEPQLEHDLQTFKTSFPVKTNLLVYLVSNRPLLNPRLKEPPWILGSFAILEPLKTVAIPPLEDYVGLIPASNRIRFDIA